MKSHEAPLGKLQCCFRLPGKLKPGGKEEKTSFPSSLGQHKSLPLIAQSELELSEHLSIPATHLHMLPGVGVFQKGCNEVHLWCWGEHPGPLPGRGLWAGGANPSFDSKCEPRSLLREDGAHHWDLQQWVALPKVFQGMRVPRGLRYSRNLQQVARLELGDVSGFPEEDKGSPHQFPTAGRFGVWPCPRWAASPTFSPALVLQAPLWLLTHGWTKDVPPHPACSSPLLL